MYLTSREPTYQATGSFFVISGSGNLGALNKIVSGTSAGTSLSDYVFVLLKSTELMDTVANELDLWSDEMFWEGEETRNAQRLYAKFSTQLSYSVDGGFIEISAKTGEAHLSASLVSSTMKAVQEKLRAESKNKTSTFETRVRNLEEQILVSDTKLEAFRVVSGLLVEAQMNERVATRAELERRLVSLRAERSGMEAQSLAPGDLSTMLQMESSRALNSGISEELTEELLEVEAQLTLAPEQLREYSALVRKAKVLESLYTLAVQNLEASRIEEEKELNPLRVVDRPRVPDEPQRSHRLRYVLAAALLGFGLGALLVFFFRSSMSERGAK